MWAALTGKSIESKNYDALEFLHAAGILKNAFYEVLEIDVHYDAIIFEGNGRDFLDP